MCHSERSVAESNFRGSKPEGGASESARNERNLLMVFDTPLESNESFNSYLQLEGVVRAVGRSLRCYAPRFCIVSLHSTQQNFDFAQDDTVQVNATYT